MTVSLHNLFFRT